MHTCTLQHHAFFQVLDVFNAIVKAGHLEVGTWIAAGRVNTSEAFALTEEEKGGWAPAEGTPETAEYLDHLKRMLT